MAGTVEFRGSREQLRQVLAALPRVLAGQAPSGMGRSIADGVTGAIAATLLSETKTAFLEKSRGGQDANGDAWAPLSPVTVIHRVLKAPAPKGGIKRKGKKKPTIWDAYRAQRTGLLFTAQTVDILRDTGRLFQSLSQAIAPGRLSVGTNVAYAKYHQSTEPRKLKKDGTPKLPRRPIVFDADRIPPVVWGRMLLAGARALAAAFGGFVAQLSGGRAAG